MDLPTYTNIWRIEKRLYKLYDLRLPMPLPIVWIGGFVGVLAPWSLLLYLLGLPFAAPWHVLYLVPPGVVTWLSTRPVIESKRLTELLQSQARYVGEPRTWCRMAPLSEPAEIALHGRIWRAAPQRAAVRVKASRKARHAQSKRAAARSREVRPAVAAAAAAAATAPVARERVAWAEVHAPRQGTAPALGQVPAVEASRAVEAPRVLETPPVIVPAVRPVPSASSTSSASPSMASAPSVPSVPSAPFVPRAPLPVVPPLSEAAAPPASGPAGSAAVPEAAAPVSTSAPAVSAEEPGSAPAGTGTPVAGPASEAPADRSGGRSGKPAERAPAAGSTAGRASGPGDEAPAPAPAAPIDTEALRRLRRLAASAEAQRAAATPAVSPTPPAPPVLPEVIGPAAPFEPVAGTQEPPARQRPEAPAVPQPSVPEPPRAERPVPARAVPAERPAVVPDSVRKPAATSDPVQKPAVVPDPARKPAAPATPAVPSFVPKFVGPAPIGRRAVEAAEPGQDRQDRQHEESARRQHRKGQPAPIGRPAGTSQAWPPERNPAAQAGPGAPAATGPQPGAQGGGMSIRAVPSGPATADPVAPAVPVTGSSRGEPETRVRRVESVVGRDSSGGWRRLAQVVIGPGGGRTDGSEVDEARARAVFSGSRRVVVLGCTGGAGQTTTALMLGHTLARYREDRVLAVDASTGSHALSGRIQGESPETLSSLLSGLDNVQGYLGMRAYTSRCASGLEVLAGDSDAGAEQRLSDRTLFSDRRLGQAMDTLDRHYKTIVVDPAAALAARVLPYADQLVLVVPASEDGPDAVAMTYEWLDGHGCADLRHRAVMVVNGVSRRSMADVEQAEAVARGRCRAIVRVPWEDALAPGRADRVEPSHLRAPGRRAYLALAGVVVAGFGTVQAGRPSEEELAQ
ncbi:TcpE family conjugal transfer membrane protein [Streptosporangium sp. NPDC048865]|uniref:TcpE family conjugal transfer membrane protein n=1 Tax=Streptosporangium sp. NPDC048865 TaxID=3155766 RepID=UPI00344AF625